MRATKSQRKLIKKYCGKHYGEAPGPCSKCAYIDNHRKAHPECYQYDGTPWIAVLSPLSQVTPDDSPATVRACDERPFPYRCPKCGTNGEHYCPADVARPPREDTDWDDVRNNDMQHDLDLERELDAREETQDDETEL